MTWMHTCVQRNSTPQSLLHTRRRSQPHTNDIHYSSCADTSILHFDNNISKSRILLNYGRRWRHDSSMKRPLFFYWGFNFPLASGVVRRRCGTPYLDRPASGVVWCGCRASCYERVLDFVVVNLLSWPWLCILEK